MIISHVFQLSLSPGVHLLCVLSHFPWQAAHDRAPQTAWPFIVWRLLVPCQGASQLSRGSQIQLSCLPLDWWQKGLPQRSNWFVEIHFVFCTSSLTIVFQPLWILAWLYCWNIAFVISFPHSVHSLFLSALKNSDDTHHLSRKSREKELHQRKEDYWWELWVCIMNSRFDTNLNLQTTTDPCSSLLCLSWDVYLEGIPHCVKADSAHSLPCEVRFSFTKKIEMEFTAAKGWSPQILTIYLSLKMS